MKRIGSARSGSARRCSIPLCLTLAIGTAPAFLRQAGRAEGPSPAQSQSTPERLIVRGVENVFRLSDRLYSGGQPEGSDAFAALKALGIKTVVSVDGATPDSEAARRLGLRYVHVPVGYGGVPRDRAVRVIKAVRALPGPVYVHCHHGKHRGPTVAALCMLATEGWDRRRAVDWMKLAGTSPDYRGLFATVDGFTVPSAEELRDAGAEFPEREEMPELVAAMVQVDAAWDRLKAVQAAGYRAPRDHPDLDPPHEALQLAEHFRELLRRDDTKARGPGFLRDVEDAGRRASELRSALEDYGDSPTPRAKGRAEKAFRDVGDGCTCCHAAHRDNR